MKAFFVNSPHNVAMTANNPDIRDINAKKTWQITDLADRFVD